MTSGQAISELFYDYKTEDIDFRICYPSYDLSWGMAYIQRIQYSRMLSHFKCLKCNAIWRDYYAVKKDDFNGDVNNIIIIAPGLMPSRDIDVDHLKEIKHETNSKLVLMLFDSLESKSHDAGWKQIPQLFSEFDFVLSYDRYDCDKYGLIHFYLPYSKRDYSSAPICNASLCFVGNNKGRVSLLNDISRKALLNSVKVDLTIVDSRFRTKAKGEGIKYRANRIPYSEVVESVRSSNCV